MTLRELVLVAVSAYDERLHGTEAMLRFGQAMEELRRTLHVPQRLEDLLAMPRAPAEPEMLPLELQAMQHISCVLGALPMPARFRTLTIVALALAPEVFSDRTYEQLLRRAKGA